MFSKEQKELKAELKERESELEDLGCWRQLFTRRRPKVKKLTEVSYCPLVAPDPEQVVTLTN